MKKFLKIETKIGEEITIAGKVCITKQSGLNTCQDLNGNSCVLFGGPTKECNKMNCLAVAREDKTGACYVENNPLVYYCNHCETGSCLRLVHEDEMLNTGCLLLRAGLVGFEQAESKKANWHLLKEFKSKFKVSWKRKVCDCCNADIHEQSVFMRIVFVFGKEVKLNVHLGCLNRLTENAFENQPNIKRICLPFKMKE